MQDILRKGLVVQVSQVPERRQISTEVLLLECSKRCSGFRVEDWIASKAESQMV